MTCPHLHFKDLCKRWSAEQVPLGAVHGRALGVPVSPMMMYLNRYLQMHQRPQPHYHAGMQQAC